MNKTAKALLIPVASFAVTVTGVSAFNSQVLEEAGLSNEEISAFEEARELHMEGNKDAARDVLAEAGIDLDTMHKVRMAMHEHKKEMRSAVDEAVKAKDFAAFVEAVEGSPLKDIVTTEADFNLFVEAHELREAGEREEAKKIMEELGFPEKMGHVDGKDEGLSPGHGKGFRDGHSD